MTTLIPSELLLSLVVLISGLIALVATRLVIVPRRRMAKAQKRADEIMQRKALARANEITQAQRSKSDPWSQTCSHDTISRKLTKSQIRSLEKIGMNY
jgi:flagellar biosynthesis/type III secretory pathway M-ring protein FliF/YscJ